MKRFLARTAGWVAPTLVVIATLIAFSPALSNEFVDWDDPHNFTNNPAYQGLGWSQLTWMATTFHLGVYQPLAWAAAGVEYTIGGLDPAVYHVGSWLFHAATAAMVYAIAVLLLAPSAPSPTRLRVCAAAAALVFAVHPLRVEAVAWASAQGYPLAGMLFAGSVAAYLRAHRWPERASDPSGASAVHRAWFIVSLTLGLLAYLAKPIAVTLPAMLVVLDWFPLRRLGGSGFGRASVWIEKLPYAIPAAAVAIVAPLARSTLSGPDQYGLAAKVGRGFYGLAFYLWKTLAPVGLSHYYASPPHVNAFDPRFLVSAGIVLVVGTTVWSLRSRWPALAAAALAYTVLLSPGLGVVAHGTTLAADRYSYLAGGPLAILFGAALMTGWRRIETERWRIRLGGVAVAVTVAGLGLLTWQQVQVWHDPETLWTHAVAVAPKSVETSFQVHNNLGLYYLEKHNLDAALREFDETLRLYPESYKGHLNRGLTLARQGKPDEAIQAYRRGLALHPNDPTAQAHIAELLAGQGRYTEAEAAYRNAISLAPHPDLFNSLGIVLAEQGRLDEAIGAFREALARDPRHEDAQANLETALKERSR